MPIDVTVRGTPGWWMQRLSKLLEAQQPRLQLLDAYRRGRPPLVNASTDLQSAFYEVQFMSRANFADQIVTSRTGRMTVRSIRTAAAQDDNGDQAAWRLWAANHLDIGSTDHHDNLATFGVGYIAVGAAEDENGDPVITVEDPRQMITIQDPLNPLKTLAALKLFHDDVRDMDYAYLWLPGEMWVAQRPRKAIANAGRVRVLDGPPPPKPVSFSAKAFDLLPVGDRSTGTLVLDPEQSYPALELGDDFEGPTSEKFTTKLVPIVKCGNRKGIGEFELHVDLLNRINYEIKNKIVIATYQAFKQRAIEVDAAAGDDGGLPDTDEDGKELDYNKIFEADPGALWRLPIGAKIWESGQVDMTGILAGIRDSILQLSSASHTPFPQFSPDSANQSANGASLYREGLTFRVEDLCKIAGAGWAEAIAIAFRFLDDAKRGDTASVIIDWAPADRYSILEMAQADAASSLPLAQKASRIYGMTPDEVQITLAQAAQEQFAAAALKTPTAPPPKPVVEPPVLADQGS